MFSISVRLWLFSIMVLLFAPWIGMENITLSHLFSNETLAYNIFFEIRLPRALLAWFAGGALALSGLCLQAMLRNPLAEPFTLGIASSASLGAALYIHLGWSFSIGIFSGLSIVSALAALASSALIAGMSHQSATKGQHVLLLTGVCVSFFCNGVVLLLQLLGSPHHMQQLLRWMVGAVPLPSYGQLFTLMCLILPCFILIGLFSPRLNLLRLGTLSVNRGLQPQRTLLIFYIVTSLMISAIVSLCGPIGFIGLVIPHLIYALVGQDYRYNWHTTFALGAGLLLLADTLARTLFAPIELPVGIVCIFIGAPCFLWILLRKE